MLWLIRNRLYWSFVHSVHLRVVLVVTSGYILSVNSVKNELYVGPKDARPAGGTFLVSSLSVSICTNLCASHICEVKSMRFGARDVRDKNR